MKDEKTVMWELDQIISKLKSGELMPRPAMLEIGLQILPEEGMAYIEAHKKTIPKEELMRYVSKNFRMQDWSKEMWLKIAEALAAVEETNARLPKEGE